MLFRCVLFICFALFWQSSWCSSHLAYRLCGEELNEMLDVACPEGVPSIMSKRTGPSNDSEFISLSEILSKRSLLRHRRYTLGLTYAADECCKKPCTRNELLGYCRPREAAK